MTHIDSEGFKVFSRSNDDTVYTVDMELGVCSCPAGLNGNACVHQAAVSLHFHVGGINVVVC